MQGKDCARRLAARLHRHALVANNASKRGSKPRALAHVGAGELLPRLFRQAVPSLVVDTQRPVRHRVHRRQQRASPPSGHPKASLVDFRDELVRDLAVRITAQPSVIATTAPAPNAAPATLLKRPATAGAGNQLLRSTEELLLGPRLLHASLPLQSSRADQRRHLVDVVACFILPRGLRCRFRHGAYALRGTSHT